MPDEYRSLDDLKLWDKNPRAIMEEDYERLKKQIKRLGQYKPLIVTEDGTVLGGNMRLRAYRDLGMKEAWVSVVKAENEEKKIEYALSDNDRAGYYDEVALTELVSQFPEFDLDLYKIDLGKQITIGQLSNFKNDYTDDEEIAKDMAIEADEVLVMLKMKRPTYDSVKEMIDAIVAERDIVCKIKG